MHVPAQQPAPQVLDNVAEEISNRPKSKEKSINIKYLPYLRLG